MIPNPSHRCLNSVARSPARTVRKYGNNAPDCGPRFRIAATSSPKRERNRPTVWGVNEISGTSTHASFQLVSAGGDFVQGFGVDSDFNIVPGQLDNVAIPVVAAIVVNVSVAPWRLAAIVATLLVVSVAGLIRDRSMAVTAPGGIGRLS